MKTAQKRNPRTAERNARRKGKEGIAAAAEGTLGRVVDARRSHRHRPRHPRRPAERHDRRRPLLAVAARQVLLIQMVADR